MTTSVSLCLLLLPFAAAADVTVSDTPPLRAVAAHDTSPGWHQRGQRVLITGTVTRADGRTPVPDVLIYYYHTDIDGRYRHRPGEPRSMPPNAQGQTHGSIRGWVRTDRNGRYRIYTVRPGTYPSRDFPAHVHMTVKEPNDVPEYYIDDVVFDDDPLLTSRYRRSMENRGGSGVVRLSGGGALKTGERNIILGKGIPGHPDRRSAPRSGKDIGEEVLSFTPFHAWGPDKGKRTCPVCAYGRYHGILYFSGDASASDETRTWLRFLEQESAARGEHLKAYYILGDERSYEHRKRERSLASVGAELGLTRVALTFVPSFSDTESDVHLQHIDPHVRNTVILYRRSRIIGSFTDAPASESTFAALRELLDRTADEYIFSE